MRLRLLAAMALFVGLGCGGELDAPRSAGVVASSDGGAAGIGGAAAGTSGKGGAAGLGAAGTGGAGTAGAGAAGVAGTAGASGAGAAGASGAAGGGGGVTGPMDVAFATFNVVLNGTFAPEEVARRQAIVAAIASTPADVICLVEARRASDRQLIAEAAKSAFPHIATLTTDAATPVDDPTDVDGNVPQPATTPPCADTELQKALAGAMSCVKAKCSTIPDSDQGTVVPGACIATQCISSLTALVFGDPAHQRCFGCALYSMMSEYTLAEVTQGCTTDPAAGLAFHGDSGAMILSRYPLGAPSTWVLPSTAWREAILSAPVILPNGATVRATCQTLTGPKSTSTQPYTGQYGKGPTSNGWENETLLEAQKSVAWLKKSSERTVLMGDFYVGPAAPAAGVAAVGPDAFAALAALPEALAQGFSPTCTSCFDNLLVGGGAGTSTWTLHHFLSGIEPSSVKATETFFASPTVPLSDGTHVTLSPKLGWKTIVTISP